MRVLFMGTSNFSVPTLEFLIKNHEVVGVVTQPDRKQGRGNKIIFSDVKNIAVKNNIPVFQPEKIKTKASIKELQKFNADIFVVVAYGQILSEEILNITELGCINVHGSLLPKYRGAAPIQWAIINGEEKTGVTTMYMDIGIDTGDILLKKEMPILESDTSETLFNKLSVLGGEVLIETLEKIENKTIAREKQNSDEATYTKMITKDMGHINFNQTSKDILNLIKGLDPWPSSFCYYDDEIIKIWQGEIYNIISDKENGTILEILKDGFVVKTKDSSILITEIQGQSSKRMSVRNYLNGRTLEVNKILK